MENKKLSKKFQNLISTLKEEENFIPATIKHATEEANLTVEDLMPWADFDHPKADSYGRKLVYDGGHFEVMVMSWVDGDMAAIHDHGHTQWGAVQVFGKIEHAVFQVKDNILTTLERNNYYPGDVIPVGHDLIHQMGNVGQPNYLTLHIYGCYGYDGVITGDARLYECNEQKIQFTDGGIFFDLPEEYVKRRAEGPKADFPTWLRHEVELLKRMMYKNDSWQAGRLSSDRERTVADKLFAAQSWKNLSSELDQKMIGSDREWDRYIHILQQELFAMGKLQMNLMKAGLSEANIGVADDKLTALVRNKADNLFNFSEAYLNLLGQAYGIRFPEMTRQPVPA